MRDAEILMGVALGLSSVNWWTRAARVPQRRWRTMKAPHVYPPNPFESRQVRRARERQEDQRRGATHG